MEKSKTYDILIVGGGIAGLYCGVELLRRRPKSRIGILEKFKYLGGRVVTFHKDVEEVGEVAWENGAGRIAGSHSLVHGLIKRYGLPTAPLGTQISYLENYGGTLEPNLFEEAIGSLVALLEKLPAADLAQHTLIQLCERIMGSEKAKAFFLRFPYRGEVHALRADLALPAFKEEMGSHEGYTVLSTGLSSMIAALQADFEKRGGIVVNQCELVALEKEAGKMLCKTRLGPPKEGDERPLVSFIAEKVILALHAEALRKIPKIKDMSALHHLKMFPLLRTYGVFPVKGDAWFASVGRFVTPTPVRYFIPIDAKKGIAMVSYTDFQDTLPLIKIKETEGEEALGRYILKELRRLLPDIHIPDYLFFKSHPWTYGETYWLTGDYSPAQEQRKALRPFAAEWPEVYCCGESFSFRQAWMEGALENAKMLLNRYF